MAKSGPWILRFRLPAALGDLNPQVPRGAPASLPRRPRTWGWIPTPLPPNSSSRERILAKAEQ